MLNDFPLVLRMEENPYKSPECDGKATPEATVKRSDAFGSIRFWAAYVFCQFLAANLLSPGDGGEWLRIMMPLLAFYNVFLFVCLLAVRKFSSPSSRKAGLDWIAFSSIIVSPVFVVVLATILLGMY